MNKKVGLSARKRLSALIISTALASWGVQAADMPATGNLTLQDSVRLAIKNAPSMIMASIQVDLKKADEMEAGDPFDPTVKASLAYDAVRGYQYPDEFQRFAGEAKKAQTAMGTAIVDAFGPAGAMLAPAIPAQPEATFMTDRQNNTEFKTSLSKLFRNGVYADFSITLQSSDSAKLRSDLTQLPGTLSNGIPGFMDPLRPGAVMGDYYPVHPSTIQLLINVPFLKMNGENNIAAANERMKRLEREAAEMTLKHGVASIIQNVVNNYWNYKAALTKLQYTRESEGQVKRWLGGLEKSVNAQRNDKTLKIDPTRELTHLRGFATQLGVDVSKAQEAVNLARNALAEAMGISSEEARKIGQAQDDYPLDWGNVLASFDDEASRKKWNSLAEQYRADLKAANLQLEAANSIFLGAQNDEQPKLDLALILKRQGLSTGSGTGVDLSSLNTGTGDLGYTVALMFEKKLGNDKAKAQVTRTRYLKMQKEVEYNNAKRGVGLAVDSTVSTVRNSLQSLVGAKQQTGDYFKALDAMVQNDSVSLGKVFDLVVVEQARLKAVIDHITALQSVGNAVTAAHFQTGTLIKQSNDVQEVAVSDLTRLP